MSESESTQVCGYQQADAGEVGYTAERKMERALIGEYRASIERALGVLQASNLGQVTELARLPEQIKGFGHVKERHLVAARQKWARLEQALTAGADQQAA